ncbi:MAG: hypothetical protein WCG93_06205 [Paludibacter sp.]
MKNSNQTGALLIVALITGVFVYVFIFFGTEMEHQNVSASFGHLSKTKTINLFSSNNKAIDGEFSTTEIRSDLSGVSLPAHKMRSTSGGNYTQTSNPDFPTTGIEQPDVQNINQSSTTSRTTNYASNQSNAFAVGNADIQYISNPQNPTKSDINALLLLDTHAAEAAMSTQQGAKRATPALAAKTASASTNLSGNKNVQKVDGNPGEPGGSLPVGDGVWLMLSMLAFYGLFSTKLYLLLARLIGIMH